MSAKETETEKELAGVFLTRVVEFSIYSLSPAGQRPRDAADLFIGSLPHQVILPSFEEFGHGVLQQR